MRAYRFTKQFTSILALGAAFFFGSLSAFAQSTAGRILGGVTDQSGATLVGATVVIIDLQRGTSRSLTTDEAGQYVAPDLVPSTYKVRVEARGFRARYVDARRCIVTTDEHPAAVPLLAETRTRTQGELGPLLDVGEIPVLGGYVAAAANGVTTTLGRGGSDYSAALIGASLSASEIQIWTDVSGVLTADPRIVRAARTIPRLSYAEAAELAYFGAKVLHPRTIQPAMDAGIPVRICNSHAPDDPGTLVTAEADIWPETVKAIAHKRGITIVQVASARMLGAYGFLRARSMS